MINFLIDALSVFWVILVIGYIVFQIQWYRGKVKITWHKEKK